MTQERKRRVVTYERVSSEGQTDRETILTQTEELARRLDTDPAVVIVDRYVDDGVSGTTAMAEREQGQRLLADARRRKFDEVWVYKLDRLGRDDIDPLVVRRDLAAVGVKLMALHDNIDGNLEYAVRVAIAAEERRTFLRRSADGMARAARDGRFCGGIVPLGYKVEGKKQTARLAVSNELMWRSWTESDVVRQIFGWSASDRWSCRRIAEHLNSLGVPTAYQKAGRCVRQKRTRGEWTPGRIRQILTSSVYKGIYVYGKRNKHREPITSVVPSIVSEAVWDEAQHTLARNNLRPTHAKNVFLLRSVIRCGVCGLRFSGTMGRGVTWYRCNGQIAWRGRLKGECYAKGIDGRFLEPLVWADVERWLVSPGDLIDELAAEQNAHSAAAVAEAERTLVTSALADISEQRNRVLDAYRRNRVTVDEFDAQMDAIVDEQRTLEARLAELEPKVEITDDDVTNDALLAAIRERVHEGLTPVERQQIVALLVRGIQIHTERDDAGKKRATIRIEYRFAVTVTDTGTRAGQNYSNPTRVVRL